MWLALKRSKIQKKAKFLPGLLMTLNSWEATQIFQNAARNGQAASEDLLPSTVKDALFSLPTAEWL